MWRNLDVSALSRKLKRMGNALAANNIIYRYNVPSMARQCGVKSKEMHVILAILWLLLQQPAVSIKSTVSAVNDIWWLASNLLQL